MRVRLARLIFVMASLLLCAPVSAFDGKSRRCAPFKASVERVLEECGVQKEFYWLMVAESGCRVGAVSPKGAVGFWQMMPRTMRTHGCDDESDLDCQTRAAASYLRHLSKRFKTMDEMVKAWSMGGSNYAARGASNGAKALARAVERYIRAERRARKKDEK